MKDAQRWVVVDDNEPPARKWRALDSSGSSRDADMMAEQLQSQWQ
jgi:hypothetical protein